MKSWTEIENFLWKSDHSAENLGTFEQCICCFATRKRERVLEKGEWKWDYSRWKTDPHTEKCIFTKIQIYFTAQRQEFLRDLEELKAIPNAPQDNDFNDGYKACCDWQNNKLDILRKKWEKNS